MKTSKLFLLAVLGLVLSACTSTTNSGSDISVPQDLQVSARVGQSRQTTLEVTNASGSPLEYRLSTGASWLQLAAETGTLAPRTSVRVPLTVSCPAARATLHTSLVVAAGRDAVQEVAVTLRCQAPQLAELSGDLTLQALLRQERRGTLAFSNSGDAPLTYKVDGAADWLEVTAGSTGRLEPGTAAAPAFTAICPETAGTLQTALTVTSDDPDRPSATTQVTLVCADALAPGEEGFVAALGAWNWAAADDGTLGSALLLGFRYLQPTTVTVTVKGPPGWNGDAPRQLVLPGPAANGAPSEDVWTYDLLTHDAPAPLEGVYQVTATTSRGDSYTIDLSLDASQFIRSPKNITVTPTAAGVSVTWTPVAGAKAYYAVVTDPSDDVVPPQVAGPAASGLSALAAPVYARDFTRAANLKLAASLLAGQRYQVTVVAFDSDLVLGDSEGMTLPVTAAASFDTSSATQQFSYAP